MSNAVIDYQPIVDRFIALKVVEPTIQIKAFCKQQGVDYDCFWQYLKRRPEIAKIILDKIRENYHAASIKVDGALLSKAESGDPRAIELWYKRMENWNMQQYQGLTQINVVVNATLIPAGFDPQVGLKPHKLEVQNADNEIPCVDFTSAQSKGQ